MYKDKANCFSRLQRYELFLKALVCWFGVLMFHWQLHGVTQVKTTPEVGRSVPCSKAVRTAVGQVMVQAPEEVARLEHIANFHPSDGIPLMSKCERFRFVR